MEQVNHPYRRLARSAFAICLLAGSLLSSPAEARNFYQLNQTLEGLAGASLGAEVGGTCDPSGVGSGPQAEGLCTDLYRFSCAPGSWNDGTGATGTDEDVRHKVHELKTGLTKKVAQEFAGILKKPDGAYLRRVALSAFGLTHAPGCQGQIDASCERALTGALAQQVTKNLFPRGEGPAEGPRAAGLRDLDLLTQNALFRKVERSYRAEARASLRDPRTEKKLEKQIFPRVRKLLVDLIKRKVPDPHVREMLAIKVQGINFDGTECSDPLPPDATGESYNPSLSGLLIPNAFYNPAKNAFRFCNGFLLRNKSDFQIAGVVAHELAHSIDPCLIGHGPRDSRFNYSEPMNREKSAGEYPLPGLVSCLRQESSVMAAFLPAAEEPGAAEAAGRVKELESTLRELNAKILDGGTPREERERLRDQKTLVLNDLARARRLGTAEESPIPQEGEGAFCRQDQIGESVADWFSNELLPQYLKKYHPKLSRGQRQIGFSNVFRGMCDEAIGGPEKPPFDVHPDGYRRANFLLLAQPEVRRMMGCPLDPPPGVTYCEVPDVKRAK